MKERLKKKLASNSDINYLTSIFKSNTFSTFQLTGGAIVDILEDRKPKDFDITGSLPTGKEILVYNGFSFIDETKTAVTFVRNGMTVQLLKTTIPEFDYTISQARYGLGTDIFDIDLISFHDKVLVPTENAWRDIGNTVSSLSRMYHWAKKGYYLPEKTYLSLLSFGTGFKISSLDTSS